MCLGEAAPDLFYCWMLADFCFVLFKAHFILSWATSFVRTDVCCVLARRDVADFFEIDKEAFVKDWSLFLCARQARELGILQVWFESKLAQNPGPCSWHVKTALCCCFVVVKLDGLLLSECLCLLSLLLGTLPLFLGWLWPLLESATLTH